MIAVYGSQSTPQMLLDVFTLASKATNAVLPSVAVTVVYKTRKPF